MPASRRRSRASNSATALNSTRKGGVQKTERPAKDRATMMLEARQKYTEFSRNGLKRNTVSEPRLPTRSAEENARVTQAVQGIPSSTSDSSNSQQPMLPANPTVPPTTTDNQSSRDSRLNQQFGPASANEAEQGFEVVPNSLDMIRGRIPMPSSNGMRPSLAQRRLTLINQVTLFPEGNIFEESLMQREQQRIRESLHSRPPPTTPRPPPNITDTARILRSQFRSTVTRIDESRESGTPSDTSQLQNREPEERNYAETGARSEVASERRPVVRFGLEENAAPPLVAVPSSSILPQSILKRRRSARLALLASANERDEPGTSRPSSSTAEIPPPASVAQVPPAVSNAVAPPLLSNEFVPPLLSNALAPPPRSNDLAPPLLSNALAPPPRSNDLAPPLLSNALAPPPRSNALAPPSSSSSDHVPSRLLPHFTSISTSSSLLSQPMTFAKLYSAICELPEEEWRRAPIELLDDAIDRFSEWKDLLENERAAKLAPLDVTVSDASFHSVAGRTRQVLADQEVILSNADAQAAHRSRLIGRDPMRVNLGHESPFRSLTNEGFRRPLAARLFPRCN